MTDHQMTTMTNTIDIANLIVEATGNRINLREVEIAEFYKFAELLLARRSSMGAEPDNVPYMIVFDDADKKPEMLIGRDAAYRRYSDLSVSWNAHLFAKVNSNSRDCKYPDAVLFAPPSANMGEEPVIWYNADALPYETHGVLQKKTGNVQFAILGCSKGPFGTFTTPLYASAPPSADAKDAERYRFLRDSTIVDGEINEELYVRVDSQNWPNRWALTGQELDSAIDAAISASKEASK